jgi:diguanylate cyclase (GGDEF)-like protein
MASALKRWVYGRKSRGQRLRMTRFLMSAASYTMWYGFALTAQWAGMLSVGMDLMLWTGIGILLSQLVFYALLRSDLNERFRDPSLTVAQILVGLAWGLALIAVSREIRGIMLAVYMVTLLFGIFALDRRQFRRVALLAFLGYAGLAGYEYLAQPGLFSDGYHLMSVLILAGVLIWTTLFGIGVSDLRYKLFSRNQELEEALAKIQVLAERDDLTGLYNRRFIMKALQKEKGRADRSKESFCVCIIDLDHFKEINDRYGHGAGDTVLKNFARFMTDELRELDVVASAEESSSFGRYGGEEFILLLPDTDMSGARNCVDRLREKNNRHNETHSGSPPVTFSAGVAEYVEGEPVESLLRRADQALYDAKHDGRDRVFEAR